MKPEIVLAHEFVDFIPDDLKDSTLYISFNYSTAVHKCCCGCGREVVTPLSPTGWQLIFDGTISLYPSIGSWGLPCQSHYFITHNRVDWARKWSNKQVAAARARETKIKEKYYGNKQPSIAAGRPSSSSPLAISESKQADVPVRRRKP